MKKIIFGALLVLMMFALVSCDTEEEIENLQTPVIGTVHKSIIC